MRRSHQERAKRRDTEQQMTDDWYHKEKNNVFQTFISITAVYVAPSIEYQV